jgi:hypothetical protein
MTNEDDLASGGNAIAVGLARLLGWRCGIRTDSVEGRIRTDSGGFRAAPQGAFLAYFAFCMGILTLSKWVPDSDRFGRESDLDGFGRIPGPQIWKSPSQPDYACPTTFNLF